MKLHVKKSDLVVVLSGNDRGKRGKVLSVDPKSLRVVVEGVRMMKKAARKTQDRPQGGFIEREAALDISNVMLAEEYDRRRGARSGKKQEASNS
jgi:large subunit ribosomal protein L24